MVLPSSNSRVPSETAEGADLKEPFHSVILFKCRVTEEGAGSGWSCHPVVEYREKLRKEQSQGTLPSRESAEGADLKEPCHSVIVDKC